MAQEPAIGAPDEPTPAMIDAAMEVLFENYPDTADGGDMDRLMIAEMFRAARLAAIQEVGRSA